MKNILEMISWNDINIVTKDMPWYDYPLAAGIFLLVNSFVFAIYFWGFSAMLIIAASPFYALYRVIKKEKGDCE